MASRRELLTSLQILEAKEPAKEKSTKEQPECIVLRISVSWLSIFVDSFKNNLLKLLRKHLSKLRSLFTRGGRKAGKIIPKTSG